MLQLKNITKNFPGTPAPTLNGINLLLQPREFCVLIGANGSGKSTLLKIISGEYLPDTGEILRQGIVAEVGQDIKQSTISAMTLVENIVLSQMLKAKPKFAFYQRQQSSIRTKIKALGLGLQAHLNQNLGNLSGGQRQAIATLMAIHSGGEILLLDEHTSALDAKMQELLLNYTAQAIAELQLTTLMITHKLDDAIKYGNRLIMLADGKIVLDIAGTEKAKLKAATLLALLHKFTDKSLL